ncbi:Pimeloyl-ACP methyl ester carboxylesterase [Cohaesibacter marisflavi]|uniref:Pimeloyl-ACP methyl ester carboxylesterase n=1 Tax=Cohaesibacter marisflavi TaxID=655353 RepID=A0A1I5FHR8_9HYPH|nr:alpha/beta hydrolase [Cohaesibacter marisflavi]SFO23280.1 Pimeloyl-ACP methyl ester carboxylesterase [Cohaesibacter marisflavi]
MPASLHKIMARSQTIHTSKGPIEYACNGNSQAPACLLIHGGMGGIDQSALLGIATLGSCPAIRTIPLSRPGYLGSPLSGRKSPKEQADLFAGLLDELQIDRAAIMAISAGGPSAIEFAARYQDRCAALILVSCCTTLLPVKRAIRMRLGLMSLLSKSESAIAWLQKRARQNPAKTASRSISDPALLKQVKADTEAWPLMQALQDSLFDRMPQRLPGTINDTQQLSKERDSPFACIQCPTLIIHGERDPVVPFDHALIAQQTIKTAELHPVKNAEHVALFTHLEEIRSLVGSFLKAHQADTAKT